MNEPAQRVVLPSGFAFDRAAAAAHVMQPPHTRGVVSSRGLEEGATKFALREQPAGGEIRCRFVFSGKNDVLTPDFLP